MKSRIPLWLDIADVPAVERAAILAAAEIAQVERILDGDDLPRFSMSDGLQQELAAHADGPIIVAGDDWTVIPLENLIAARVNQPGTLFALAREPAEAALFRDVLEVGVHGVVLIPANADAVLEADKLLRARGVPPPPAPGAASEFLVTATITNMQDAGTGDRVCIDCTSAFEPGEGLLIGSTARSFVLVHAETLQSEFVNPRPFRVNAGAIHSYLLGPDGRTSYLSEVASGGEVLAVDASGGSRSLRVGRAKIEVRPHLLIEWSTAAGKGSAILQNAETIRLIRPSGAAVSITDISVGDEVLVHNETAARHFGMPVEESLEER